MIKSKQFIIFFVFTILALFLIINFTTSAQANNTEFENISTPTVVPLEILDTQEEIEIISLEEQESIKDIVNLYFETKYKALSVSESEEFEQNGFDTVTSNMREFQDALGEEVEKLNIEIKNAEMNELRYVEYQYFLDFSTIKFDVSTQIATVILFEDNEVIYEISAKTNPDNPIKSHLYNREHTIILQKTQEQWVIISDTYNDFLWRTIREGGISTEEILFEMESLSKTSSSYIMEDANNLSSLPADSSSHAYDRAGAVEYALKYVYNYNPNYPSYDVDDFPWGDCTNFISQSIYEGGNASMHIPNIPPPISDGGQSGWYLLNDWQRATDWNWVDGFYSFVTNYGSPDEGPEGYLLLETNDFTVPSGLMIGDIIQFEKFEEPINDQSYDHAVIVVGFADNGLPFIASHSEDRAYEPYTIYYPWESVRFIHIERSDGHAPIKTEITSVADDAGGNPGNPCLFTNTDPNNNYLGSCFNGGDVTSGFMFRDIQIPYGAQIKYAFVTFTTDGTYGVTSGAGGQLYAPISLNIYGENVLSPVNYSTNNTPAQRTTLTSPVPWKIDGTVNGAAYDTWYWRHKRTTPDISSIIESIVNISGWEYGNPLSLIFQNNTDGNAYVRRVIAKELMSGSAYTNFWSARLVVAYSLEGTPASTAPVVYSVTRATASPTNASVVDFTVTFSETVTGVDASDFALIQTGTSGAVINSVTGSGNIYTVQVNTGSGNGEIRLNVIDNNSIVDVDLVSLNGGFTTGEAYTIDKIPPTVLSILRDSINPTSAGSVSYIVTFSEIVTGIDVNDFNVTSNNLAGVGVANVTPITGTSYRVFVAINYGNGTLQLHLVDNDTILDRATNPLGGIGIGNGNLSGEVYDVNRNPVTLNSTPSGPAVTNANTVNFVVTFSESVTGVDTNDFTLTTVGVTDASVASVSGSGSTYTVSVNTGVGDGTIRLDIIDNDTILNSSSVPLVEEFITGQSVTIDKSQPWNTFLGGVGSDRSYSLVKDEDGNFYSMGVSNSSWGNPIRAYSGMDDVFVAKIDATGNLVWNTFLGDIYTERIGYQISVDESGNVYVIGSGDSTWGTPVRAYLDLGDAFVAKLSPSGNLLWHTFLGGSTGYDAATGITVKNGVVYVVGNSNATWGNPINIYTTGNESYLASLDTQTGILNWHTFFGGSGEDIPFKIYVSNSNHLYVSGYGNATWGTPVQPHSPGNNNDGYVVKFNLLGSLLWNTFLGANGLDIVYDIDEDSNGDLYLAGRSSATWGDPLNIYAGGSIDAFVGKLNPTTGTLLWHSFVGGSGSDFVWSIEVDANDNINIAGSSDVSWGSPIRIHAGDYEAFYAKINSVGGLLANTFVGGIGADRGYGIVLGVNNDVYISGYGNATWDNPIQAYSGDNDSYVTRINLIDFPLIVSSITRASTNPTSVSSINFTAVFSESVTGVDVNDFALTTAGVTGASITNVSGSGSTYTVTVSTGSGEGTIRLDVINNGTIVNIDSQALINDFLTGQTYIVDKVIPTVISSVRSPMNPNTSGLNFTVTFSEQVTGVDTTDFSLTTTGVTGASVSSVTGSGNSYVVNVNGGSGSGTVRLNVIDNDTIIDAASKPLGGVGAGNGSFTTGQTYTVTSVTLNSLGTQDGHILESTENSGVGGTVNSTSASFVVGDDVTDRQYLSILHFNTSTLPDTAVISSATLRVRQQTITGTNPFTTHGSLIVDIQQPYFGTNNSLVVGDFEAVAGQSSVATFNSTPVSSWYSALLNPIGFVYINLTSTTQIRIAFTLDDNDDNGVDYIAFSSGNHATTAYRPQIVIQYYIP